MEVPIREAQVGDWALFPSGPRRIEQVWKGGVAFVALRAGVIGNYRTFRTRPHWRVRVEADGKRLTTYTWNDLKRLGCTHARAGRDPAADGG